MSSNDAQPIRTLIVDDSRVIRVYVSRLLESAPDFELLEPAKDGREAVQRAASQTPDVILMDLQLPEIDGLTAIEQIMAETPCPIVVFSGQLSGEASDRTFSALQAGAVDVVAKPEGLTCTPGQNFDLSLLRTLRLMSGVKVITSRGFSPARSEDDSSLSSSMQSVTDIAHLPMEAIAIGASTGGPPMLFELLDALPAPMPVPIFIAQHITDGFEHGLCSWLGTTGHQVEIPLPGTHYQPGRVYVSPANASLMAGAERLVLHPPVGRQITPNIDRLFESLADRFGARACGILLSGMGCDGAQGLKKMRHTGGWTIAQEPSDAVIDSMPASAAEIGAARELLTLDDIKKRLQTVASRGVD